MALIAGLAAILATLAGSFGATMLVGGEKEPQKKAPPATELLKLDVISVPVIRSGRIQGYVIARGSVGAAADEVKSNRALLSAYSVEGLFRAIYEENLDFDALKPVDLTRLADTTTRMINERIGRQIVSSTVFENLNFVPPSGVRQSGPGKK